MTVEGHPTVEELRILSGEDTFHYFSLILLSIGC
jgi:hypothetical protein